MPHGSRVSEDVRLDKPAWETASPGISVIIPTLNEAMNLPHVLPRIPSWVSEVIIVDGNSLDGTADVAKELMPSIKIINEARKGKGRALRTGIESATGSIIITLDADGSADPAEIPVFVGALLAGADFVKGSRFMQGGGTSDMEWHRRLGNWGFVTLVKWRFGSRFTDLCYGYNAFWKDVWPVLVVSVTDTGGPGGSFNYVVSDGSLTDPNTTVSVTRVTGTINGGVGNEIIVGNSQATTINGGGGNDHIDAGDGGDTISGGAGNDVILAGTGNDTIVWNANNTGDTDGFDIVNGQEGGADTFQLNGRQSVSETFRIYARAEAIAAGIAVMGADSEIVITRTVGQTTSVIAELDNIEEIVVNTLAVSANDGNGVPNGGVNNGDTIQVIGNFNGTSLNFSTITIDGNSGDDTVDISALTSAHRIVFRSNGGNDTIVGTLRPQDVVELPEGMTLADYEVTIDEETGQVELVGDDHAISFVATNGMPQFSSGHDWEPDDEDEDEDDTPPLGNDDDDDCDDDDDTPSVDTGDGSATAARMLMGTSAADVLLGAVANDTLMGGGAGDILAGEGGSDILRGEDGDDVLSGGDGADTMSGGAGSDELHGGSGADMLFGNDGADMVYGDGGDDIIETGAGDDKAWGGAGNDTILATANDGSDQYWGEEGNDTLDYAVATGNLVVDLGNGFMGRGQVTGNGGTDMFYGFENFIGGSGHDVITATSAVNIMDGGLGNDTFRFQSASAAHGDTIYGFAPGDKIDFSAMDANTTTGGHQGFTLSAGSTLTAAGQVAVSYDVRDGAEVTLVRGNVDGDPGVDFELTLMGRHTLTANDFNGVS